MHPEIDSKQNLPRVTVVTAVFNLVSAGRVELFRQCMDSVSSQSYPNIEHLIIDGASTDGTLDLLREYNGRNGVRVLSEPDTGIYDAMNKGLRAATGKYIAFMNSDDYWHDPRGVACSVEWLERAQADFSYAPCHYVHSDGSDAGDSIPELGNAFSVMPFCHQTMLTLVARMREVGGFADKELRITADYDLLLNLLLRGAKPVYVPLNFTTFRMGGISAADVSQTEAEFHKSRVRQLQGLLPVDDVDILECGYMPKKLYMILPGALHPLVMSCVADAYGPEIAPYMHRRLLKVFRIVQSDKGGMDCGWCYSGIFGLPLLRPHTLKSGMLLHLLFGFLPLYGIFEDCKRHSTRWFLFGVLPALERRVRTSGSVKWKLFGVLIWSRYPKRK